MKAGIALVAVLSLTQIGLAQPPGGQEGRPAPPPLKNIQVFPKDITRADLMAKMFSFNSGLGVRCTFCHVEDEATHRVADYSLDTNPHKNIARKMITMTEDINQKYLATLGGDHPTDASAAVGCGTCHQGHMQPQPFAPAAGGGPGGPGGPGAGGPPPGGMPQN